MSLTGQERVRQALNHRAPDRVPVDLSGHRSSGIAAIAYRRLRDYLGLPKKTIRVYDPLQQLAIVDEEVLDRFGIDTIELVFWSANMTARAFYKSLGFAPARETWEYKDKEADGKKSKPAR